VPAHSQQPHACRTLAMLQQHLLMVLMETAPQTLHLAQHASHSARWATLHQVLQAAVLAHSQQPHACRTLAMLQQHLLMALLEAAPQTLHLAQHASHSARRATLHQVLQAAVLAHSQQPHACRTLAMLQLHLQTDSQEAAPRVLRRSLHASPSATQAILRQA